MLVEERKKNRVKTPEQKRLLEQFFQKHKRMWNKHQIIALSQTVGLSHAQTYKYLWDLKNEENNLKRKALLIHHQRYRLKNEKKQKLSLITLKYKKFYFQVPINYVNAKTIYVNQTVQEQSRQMLRYLGWKITCKNFEDTSDFSSSQEKVKSYEKNDILNKMKNSEFITKIEETQNRQYQRTFFKNNKQLSLQLIQQNEGDRQEQIVQTPKKNNNECKQQQHFQSQFYNNFSNLIQNQSKQIGIQKLKRQILSNSKIQSQKRQKSQSQKKKKNSSKKKHIYKRQCVQDHPNYIDNQLNLKKKTHKIEFCCCCYCYSKFPQDPIQIKLQKKKNYEKNLNKKAYLRSINIQGMQQFVAKLEQQIFDSD